MGFKASGDGIGGAYFRAVPGMMRGVFLGTTDGPTFTKKNEKTGELEDAPQMRWNFRLKDMAGTPLFYVNDEVEVNGIKTVTSRLVPEDYPDALVATADALSSVATGPKSKARSWFVALLNRQIEGPLSTEQIDAILAECEGKEVYLTFAYNTSKPPRVAITGIVPMPPQV